MVVARCCSAHVACVAERTCCCISRAEHQRPEDPDPVRLSATTTPTATCCSCSRRSNCYIGFWHGCRGCSSARRRGPCHLHIGQCTPIICPSAGRIRWTRDSHRRTRSVRCRRARRPGPLSDVPQLELLRARCDRGGRREALRRRIAGPRGTILVVVSAGTRCNSSCGHRVIDDHGLQRPGSVRDELPEESLGQR